MGAEVTPVPPARPRILVTGFAVISGVGWLIDFALFNLLVGTGVPPGRANLVSAGVEVLFVFITSRRQLFRGAQRPLAQAMGLYVGYNIIAVAVASLAVGALSGVATAMLAPVLARLCPSLPLGLCAHISGIRGGLGPALAKIVVTPATMYANFIASAFINTKRFRLA